MIHKTTLRRMAAMLLIAAILALSGGALAAYNMPYYIDVDITNQITTIYHSSDGSIARQMICSTGINNGTPLGVWHMVPKGRASERTAWTWLNDYHCYVKYMTRVHLGYMFHSLPFSAKEEDAMIPEAAEKLGEPDSHGCVRLRVEDAYFIAMNCLEGTRVNFYESGERNEELRELLLVSTYSDESGMSYQEFLGYGEGELCRGCAGTEVQDLQNRMRDLGYYDGSLDGLFGMDLTTAVKRIQKDMGRPQNGIATEDFLKAIYADDAPVSEGEIALEEGRSGPVVKKLQQSLNRLNLYTGNIDGIYDRDVADAVRAFQGICGYGGDGAMSPEMQQALGYMIGTITEKCGEDFTTSLEAEEITMAKVEAPSKIIVREKTDTKSKEVGKVDNGDHVMVLGVEGSWANILKGESRGYIYKKYLKPYTQSNAILSATGNGETVSFGHRFEEYMTGTPTFADEFHQLFISGRFDADFGAGMRFATVATGSDDVALNLRAEADGSSAVLLTVPNGTQLEVIAEEGDFTRVSYGGSTGYLMNAYLSFSEGEGEVADDRDEAGDAPGRATVASGDGAGKAPVYAEGSEESKLLGKVKDGAQVEVLGMSATDEWVHISIEGHEGYMKDADLRFELS